MPALKPLKTLLPLIFPGAKPTRFQAAILANKKWVQLVQDASLGALFFSIIKNNNHREIVPPLFVKQLEQSYAENIARYLLIEHWAEKIFSQLNQIGCFPLVLKGLPFAKALYPDPYSRYIGDIDLFVGKTYESATMAIFDQLGLDQLPPSRKKHRKLNQLFRKLGLRQLNLNTHPPNIKDDRNKNVNNKETIFINKSGDLKILIELHHNLINLKPSGGKADVFKTQFQEPQTTLIKHGQATIRVLEPNACFIYALRHLALHHRFIGFRWHIDLALMLYHWRSQLDPVYIQNECQKLGSLNLLTAEAYILKEMFGLQMASHPAVKYWQNLSPPFMYSLFRHVALNGSRTPLREPVRNLLAPNFFDIIRTFK